jgi:hypothetical protein
MALMFGLIGWAHRRHQRRKAFALKYGASDHGFMLLALNVPAPRHAGSRSVRPR